MKVRLTRVLALAVELGATVATLSPEFSPDASLASFQASALAPMGPLDRQRLLAVPSTRSRLGLLDDMLQETEQILALQLGDGAGPADDE